jgi:hypothetical protein
LWFEYQDRKVFSNAVLTHSKVMIQKLIEKKRNIKQGAMQQLLSPTTPDGKLKKGWSKEVVDYFTTNGQPLPDDTIESIIKINCYMLEQSDIESNPNLTGEYNVARAVTTFNKRIEPLLICFNKEVRENLLVDEPKDRGIFTTSQCELINGVPFEEGDQDRLNEDVLEITPQELGYWDKRGLNPDYMYELAEEGWKDKLGLFESVAG